MLRILPEADHLLPLDVAALQTFITMDLRLL